MLRLTAVTTAALLLTAPTFAQITTATLLEEMNDLQHLVEYPDPAYQTGQFSSYDRRSDDPSNETTWFANYDRGQYLRTEERDGRTEYVLMDAAGPGALVRIWSANPQGTLRFYIDNQSQPAWTVPMADLLGGELDAIPEPLSGRRAAGWNVYFPIPYAEHLKVTSDKSEQGGFYYLINYRTYEDGTKVRSFTPADLEANARLTEDIADALAQGAPAAPDLAARSKNMQELVAIAPGDTETVATLDGAWMITALATLLKANDRDRALRQTILEITFDGQQTVASPLGDFFGSAPGINAYSSLPLRVRPSGEMLSHWPMPFKDGATIKLRNLGDQNVQVDVRLALVGYKWNDRSMHFHARWRSEFDRSSMPSFDWNYATIDGQGVYVGSAFHITNPVRQWWGEGDEKIYVDGEEFPSFFGTGTEDYYGYAWCSPERFQHAYHNQTRCDGPANYGHTSVNRWHIIDAIPFEEHLRFDMELLHWVEADVDLFMTAYWYARPGAESQHKPITASDVRVQPVPEYQAPRVPGAIEGEEMTILAKTANPAPQYIANASNDHHLWWHGGVEPGEVLKLAFESPAAGRYAVFGRFVKAHDYGRFKLALNDTPIDEEMDFFIPPGRVAITDEIKLGTFDLKHGRNTLTVTATGAHPEAKPEHMFGLDYLRLEGVKASD